MSAVPVNAAVVDKNTIVKAEVLSSGKAVKVKAIAGGKYILSEGENGVAPENITLKRVGQDLHVFLEGSDLNQPEMVITDFYSHPGELVGKGEDGQWHQYTATSGEEGDEAAFLMDGSMSSVALGSAEYPGAAGLNNLSVAGFAISPALMALGALAALAAATGLGYLAARHVFKKDDDNNGGEGEGEGDGNGNGTIPNTIVVDSITDKDGNPVTVGGTTSDNTPVVKGTGTPGNIVIIREGGEPIGSTPIDSDGNWTWVPVPPLTDGDHDLEIVEGTPGGGISDPKPGPSLIVDTVAPSKATIGDVLNDDGESVMAIGSTNDTTPTVTGTIAKPEPGKGLTVEIFDQDGNKVGEGDVADDGTWSVELTTPLGEGNYDLSVVVVDKANNRSEPSEPVTITIDLTAPVLPGDGGIGPGTALEGAWDDVEPKTGWIDPGSETNDARPDFNGGGLEPGDTVIIKDNGVEIGTAVVSDDGTWTFTPETDLGDGAHSIVIVVKDPANNESDPSDPLEFVVDTSLVPKPTTGAGGNLGLANDDVGIIVGDIEHDGVTDDTRPEFKGEGLKPGETVYITDTFNGVDTLLGTAIVGEDGSWSFTPETDLAHGDHSVSIVVENQAGTQSEPSDPYVFDVDLEAPDLGPGGPTIGLGNAFEGAWDDIGDRTGWINEDGTTPNTDDDRPEFKGAGLTDEAGSLVIIMDNGTPIGSTVIQPDGTWSWTPERPMGNGPHSVNIKIQDPAGHQSPESDALDFNIVTGGAPAQPAINGVYNDDGTGIVLVQENAFTNDDTPLVRGTGGEAGNIIHVYNGSNVLGTAIVDANGNWEFPVPASAGLTDGPVSIHVVEESISNGNSSEQSGSWDFNLDTLKPDAPSLSLSNDIGSTEIDIPSGTTTEDDTPILRGTSTEPGGYISVWDGLPGSGTFLGTTQVLADGSWSFPVPALADGPHNINVVQTDRAGNDSDPTAYDVTIDTSLVAVRITHMEQDNAQSGDLGSPARTNDSTPTVHGIATPGELVTVFVDGVAVDSVMADETDGSWSYELNLPTDKQYQVRAEVNGSTTPSGNFLVTLDSSAPAGTFTNMVDNLDATDVNLGPDAHTRDTTPRLEGTVAEDNVLVTIYDGETAIGSIFVERAGSWNWTPDPLNDATYNLSATFTDDVGNESGKTPVRVVTVDTTPPDAPVIEQVIDQNGDPITGETEERNPSVIGTANPEDSGNIIIIKDQNGEVKGSGTVEDDGSWRVDISPGLNDGSFDLVAEISDKAGNTAQSPSVNIVLDLITEFNYNDGWIRSGVYVTELSIDPAGKFVASGTHPWPAGENFNGEVMYKEIEVVAGQSYEFTMNWQGVYPDEPVAPFEQSTIYLEVNGERIIGPVSQYGEATFTGVYTAEASGTVRLAFSNDTATSNGNDFVIKELTMRPVDTPEAISVDTDDNVNEFIYADGWDFNVEETSAIDSSEGIQGDSNTNTLIITGEDQILDLTQLGNKVSSIEVIDITGTGNNTLNISLGDILANGDSNLFINDDSVQMMVKGNEGDVVNLDDMLNGTDPGDWAKATGVVEVSGVRYEVYKHSTVDAELLVQEGVTTNLV